MLRKFYIRSAQLLQKRSRSSASISVPTHVDSDPILNHDSRELYNDKIRPYGAIPGPRALPIVGNSWRFLPVIGHYKLEEIDLLSKELYNQYGDVVKIEGILGRPDMVFLYDADEIEKVFRNEDTLPYRPSMPSLNYYKHVLRKDFFGETSGVIAVHGKKWLEFRSKVQQPILQPRIVRLYVRDIEDAANAFVYRIKRYRNENNEVKKDFLNEIHLWSLESIARVALDVKLGCLNDVIVDEDTQRFIDAVNTFFKNVGVLELKIPFWKVFNTPTWKKYVNSLDTIRSFTTKYVNKAICKQKFENVELAEKHNWSLLQRVLAMDPDNPKTATILALDMFLVGIDTTSAAVASILYQLSQNQDKQQVLYDEISAIIPNINNPLTIEKIDQLIYLKAFIKETLRMYPVVLGNGRTLTKDSEICGYNVPEGVQIVFQHYVASNSDRYFENSNEFKPERWLKINKQKNHPFASLPFGFGKRMCLGRRFAELEIQTVITKIVQNFHIDFKKTPLKYSVQPMYMPKGDLIFTLTDRSP